MHLFTEGEGKLTYTLLGDPGDLGDLQNPGSVTPLRSKANKYLQSKSDLNKRFRTSLEIFPDKTDGLSLNAFLTKLIQRVTRYLFIHY
jgi:hypothetical protein